LISVSRGVSLHVVGPRPRRAMRMHLWVQIALDRVPAAPVSALGAAAAPADHDQIAYSAASTTSAESTASRARVVGPEASCHGAQAAIGNDVATHKLKGFGSKALRPRVGLKVTGSRYATADLNALTEAREESPRRRRSSCREEALDHRHHNQRIPNRVIPGQGSLGPTQQLHRSGGLT